MEFPGSPSKSPTLPKKAVPPASAGAGEKPATSGRNRLGRHVVTGRLGRGGMGVVYEAEDTTLQRKVAIKILPKEVSAHPESLKRFLREAQAAAKLNHPNVVAVHDLGNADGSYYIVMELVSGGSAQDYLRARGAFSWREATTILLAVCRGVAAAHRAGLIHRDIKPANILRSTDGVVKLADFGLVKPAGRKGTIVTALGEVIGTPHYMSPEQTQSAAVDERSDIYALGATYFALLTGRPPYLADDSMQVLFAHCSSPIPDPREFTPDIPEACSAIVRKAMAKQRSQRYARAEDLLADLEGVQALTNPSSASVMLAQSPWNKVPATDQTNALSLAAAYPGEHTKDIPAPRHLRGTLIVLSVIGVVALALLLGFTMLGRNIPPTPKTELAAADDWPTLAVAAENAMRIRSSAAMRRSVEKIHVLQHRTSEDKIGERDAMRQTLAQLEKALTFRESITEKGLTIGLAGLVTSIAVSPDDHAIAAGQQSGVAGVIVFDSRTGVRRATLWPRGNDGLFKVHALAYAHDSDVLAAAGEDHRGVKLWRFSTAKESSLPSVPGIRRTRTLAFAPSSSTLLAGLEPLTQGRGRPYLKIWDIDTGNERFTFKAEHSATIRSVVFCPAGEQLASASLDKRVILWNAATGRVWRELHTGLAIHAIACNPRDSTLAAAGLGKDGHVLQFWDYAGSKLLTSKTTPNGACQGMAYSHDGAMLAIGSGSDILLWNAATLDLHAVLQGHGEPVTSLAFLREGGILVTGSDDQTMRLWDVTRWLPPRTEP